MIGPIETALRENDDLPPNVFRGAPCKKCGNAERRVSNGKCVFCHRAGEKRRRENNPEKMSEARKARRLANIAEAREKHLVHAKRYREKYPEKCREACRRSEVQSHGLTIYEAKIVREHVGQCQVCGAASRLKVDHCHSSGMIRGVLCAACNFALGAVNDSPDRLRALIEYLNSHDPIKASAIKTAIESGADIPLKRNKGDSL